MPCCLARLDKSVVVGCMNNAMHAFHIKGKKTWSAVTVTLTLTLTLTSHLHTLMHPHAPSRTRTHPHAPSPAHPQTCTRPRAPSHLLLAPPSRPSPYPHAAVRSVYLDAPITGMEAMQLQKTHRWSSACSCTM